MTGPMAFGDKRLKVALAGAGWISQFHLAGWKAVPNADIVAVCDPALDRAKARAGEFGGLPGTGQGSRWQDSCGCREGAREC
jgi:predicted dehydrogenase